MTKAEMNRAIAGACRWKDPHENHGVSPENSGEVRRQFCTSNFPHYCGDLNAMREALMTLSESDRAVFGDG